MGILGFGGWSSPCDYDDVTKMNVILSLFACHMVCHWPLRALVASWDLQLTERAKKKISRASFHRETAQSVYGFCFHSIIGPAAGYYACSAASRTPTPLWPAFDSMAQDGCEPSKQANLLGAAFTSWALFQIVWILLGWEKGLDNYIHHFLFLVITFVRAPATRHTPAPRRPTHSRPPRQMAPYFNICGELVLFAITMEVSTPALNVMLTTRQLVGKEGLSDAAGAVFALLFFASRVGFFGRAPRRRRLLARLPAACAGRAADGPPGAQVGRVAGPHLLDGPRRRRRAARPPPAPRTSHSCSFPARPNLHSVRVRPPRACRRVRVRTVRPPAGAVANGADLTGRENAVLLLHVLMSAGWVIQLFWARILVAKLAGMLRGKKSKD